MYSLLFKKYIESLLLQKSFIEFFIEGGRSRTGKLKQPKMGVLSIVLNLVRTNAVHDVVLVPISISYDRIIEGSSYSKELMGNAVKEAESLLGVIKMASILKFNYGAIDVAIGKVIRARAALQERLGVNDLASNKVSEEDWRRAVNTVGYLVMYECNRVSIARPTALIATILLTIRNPSSARGVGAKELIKWVQILRNEIVFRHGRVAQLGTNPTTNLAAIEQALDVMGTNLVESNKRQYEVVYSPKRRMELSYYKNSVIHWFVEEGITACSIHADMKKAIHLGVEESQFKVNKKKLLESVSFISRVLKYEFIFPTKNIKENFDKTLGRMIEREVIEQKTDQDEQYFTIKDTKKSRFMFNFLCSIIWPFIDTYWLVANTFRTLLPNVVMEEKSFIRRVTEYGNVLYYNGNLPYIESLNTEAIETAIGLFHEWKVIHNDRIFKSKIRTVRLRGAYVNEKGAKLYELLKSIGQFRREGHTPTTGLKEERTVSHSYAPRIPAAVSRL